MTVCRPSKKQRLEKGIAIRLLDGRPKKPQVTVRLLFSRCAAFAALARDVTERKPLEAALRQSEQKRRSVFEFLPVGVSVVEGKDHVPKVRFLEAVA